MLRGGGDVLYGTQVNVNLQICTYPPPPADIWWDGGKAPRINLGTRYEVRDQIRAPVTLPLNMWVTGSRSQSVICKREKSRGFSVNRTPIS